MQWTIGLDKDLSRMRQALEQEGYNVVDLQDNNINSVDAIVVCGMENNLLGMEETKTKAAVIDSSGKTAEEIIADIKNSLPQ
ncbi:MAG: hypothetical protein PWQ96_29 [Clostridia bacterium]|jgi:hypothetical protein|nr:YkuS family protein [Clostridiales bacterium]MDK2984387.1 hypothetical protein [Clostridia bacterium]